MDGRFLRAWFAVPRRVLGVRLAPFSLAHRLVLQVAGLDLAKISRFTPVELALAAHLCSQPRPLENFHRRPSLRLRWQCLRARLFPQWFAGQLAAFTVYIAEYSCGPQVDTPDDAPANPYPVPHEVEIVSVLLGAFREDEAWSLPVCRALWYYVLLLRARGARLHIVTTEEERAVKSKLAMVGKKLKDTHERLDKHSYHR